MDANHFDRFAQSLASGGSRRGLLAGLGSGLLAVLPLALVGEDAAAKKKGKNKKTCKEKRCGECRTCKKGKCKPQPDGACRPVGRTCQTGGCTCLAGTYFCESQTRENCCTSPQACSDTATCVACPATGAYCDYSAYANQMQCGQDSETGGTCSCVVSVEGTVACTSGAIPCGASDCTTDAECTTALGEPAICVTVVGSDCAPCALPGTTVCLVARCP